MTQHAEDRSSTDLSSQPGSVLQWMRRLWPIFCVAVALFTFGYALYDTYQIDGDAVAYMDIGDLIRSHHWAGVINGYWNPLYPAALALGHTLFHATRYTELRAYYFVNFGIFLLEMLAIVALADAIMALRKSLHAEDGRFILDRYALRYLGVALLVIASQRELSLGKVRPDALLQAFLFFAIAALLRYLSSAAPAYAALMGVVLGLAYLTKSFAFLFTLLCILALIGFGWLWKRASLPRLIVAGVLAFCGFVIVAGPYIAALSRQKGHFDFGDSGALNYAWYVGHTEKMHLQPYQTDKFGAADVHLKHPEKELLHSPLIVSYKQLPYGTYPDWFDTTFWNDSIKPHEKLRDELPRMARNVVLVFRYLTNHPEAWLLLGFLILLGASMQMRRGVSALHLFWLAPILLGVLVWAIYGMVNVEERYVTAGYLMIILPLFAALEYRRGERSSLIVPVASAVIVFMAILATGESMRTVAELRRQLSIRGLPGGWYDPEIYQTAKTLNALGVEPGDSIACIGARACLYDHYWARLAGVRILTEVYDPDMDVYPFLASLPDRSQVYDVVRRQGAKVLVGYFSRNGDMNGIDPVSAGWHELGDTPFWVYPLNLNGYPASIVWSSSSAMPNGSDTMPLPAR